MDTLLEPILFKLEQEAKMFLKCCVSDLLSFAKLVFQQNRYSKPDDTVFKKLFQLSMDCAPK